MSRNPLIIPIAAQALVVTNELPRKVNLKNQLTTGENILGKDIQFDLDNCFNETTTFKKGIHIHWNVPKIFRHGTTTDDNQIDFSAVPNHWLVVRISQQEDATLVHQSWIIKSDIIDDDANPNFAFLNKNREIEFVKIGKTEKISEETHFVHNHQIDKLTALNPVNPFFSNIYDECEDVFGFYDDMSDVSMGSRFTYVIIGCFQNENHDPVKNEKIGSIRDMLASALNTSGDNPKIDLKDVDACLFHTHILNVAWKENTTGGIHQGDVKMSLGNNIAEAFSALMVHGKANTSENLEDYLTALQHKSLDDTSALAKSDMAYIKAQNHEKTYNTKQSGIFWELKNMDQQKKMPDVQKGVAKQDPINETPYFPDDQELIVHLRKLNDAQLTSNKKSEELKSLQQLYYFKWYKSVTENLLSQQDASLLAKINEVKKDLESLTEIISETRTEITNILSQKYTKTNPETGAKELIYDVVEIPDHSFWEPNDPTVLFYGDGLGDVDHFHLDITDKLTYRTKTEIADGLNVIFRNANGEDEVIEMERKNLITSHFLPAQHPYMDINVVNDLIGEAILMSPNFYEHLCTLCKDKNVNLTEYQVHSAQETYMSQHLHLIRPNHQQAWEPLFLLWKVKFNSRDTTAEDITCQGFIPITAGARQSIEDYSSKAANTYRKILGQSLSGFNKQLLAQLPSLQILPLEYDLDQENQAASSGKVDDQLLNIIGHDGAFHLAPITKQISKNAFNPLRKGSLEIINFSLVDAFGQLKTIENTDNQQTLVVSKSLNIAGAKTTSSIPFSPKILQPARLQWDWVNKQNEKIYQDSAAVDHPVIGWFVPNYLDKQILIYDDSGQEIMGLRYSETSQKLEEFYPFNEGIHVDDLKNRRKNSIKEPFGQIINTLDVREFLSKCEILKNLYEGSANIQETNPVHVLYGKPVAIVRAKLSLEILGPVFYNPLHQFDQTYLESFYLPITLKNRPNSHHGLVGYFLDQDFTKLIYPDGHQKPIDLKLHESRDITILIKAGTEFIIDSADWLPCRSIGLFHNAMDELTKKLNISFLVGPVIADSKENQMISPNLGNNDLQWVYKSNVTTWQKPDKLEKINDENHYFGPVKMVEGWIRMNHLMQQKSEGI